MPKCVRCGHCCKVDICPYGAFDARTGACLHLEAMADPGDVTLYRCAIYDEIKNQPSVNCMPGFGTGCLYEFNADRARIALSRAPIDWRLVEVAESARPTLP